jgi:protein-S-isoprenylcysteine O-methyltransferase Ste14
VWNLSGVILVVLAAALLIWVFALGASLTPPKVKVGLTPAFLMMRGPYKFTRNPMYLAEVALWMGWAILFGSIGVLLAAVVLWAVVNYVIVPREERTLERVFGESYVNYKSSAPRWVFPQGGRSLTAPGH